MNRQFRFLLVAPVIEASTEKIITEIQRNKLYQVAPVDNILVARTYLNTGFYQCLLFDMDSLSVNAAASITDLREMGYNLPILVFSDQVNKDAFERVRNLSKVVLIEKPFESKDIWGICEKLIQGRPVHQRVFRRFPTAQMAAVEKTLTGEKYNGNIINLSRGGAYLELASGHVLPGDLLRLSIQSEASARQFDIDCEVIWSKVSGENSKNKSNVGLRFMKSEDVYRTLLHRL
jgi:hypothetical protein